MTKKPIFKLTLTALIIALIAIGIVISGIYISYMEYLEIGPQFTNVFWVDFNANLLTFLVALFVFFILCFINFYILKTNLLSIDHSFGNMKTLNKNYTVILFSVFMAIGFSVISRNTISETIMPYMNSMFFGQSDPVFHKDIGYYAFQRPFYISLTNIFTVFSGFLIFATAVIYLFFYGKFDFYNMRNIMKEKRIITHEIFLIVLYFLTKAVTYKFTKEDILFNGGNSFVGADFVDLHVWLKFYNIAPIILLIVVIL